MWITDEHGNRASVEYWGTEEKARESLTTLVDCRDCTNCSDCSDCTHCSGCTRCSGCTHCYKCSHCSGCTRCSGCTHCYKCSHCSGCTRCSNCSDCTRCSGCSDCTRCSGCSGCYDCSGCSGKYADADTEKTLVPVIDDLHRKLYAAVTARQDALNMSQWHTCKTTHCRAGWVVTLAGPEGRALEERFGTLLAAMKIYDASCPGYEISPCRFFDSKEKALADMKRLAEESMLNSD